MSSSLLFDQGKSAVAHGELIGLAGFTGGLASGREAAWRAAVVHDNGFLGGIDGDLALGADEAGVLGGGAASAANGNGRRHGRLLKSEFQGL